jgi:hypothetical protein
MLHTHHFNATFIRRTSGRKLGTFKANLFLIGEHWPETYIHDNFLFSEALRGYTGCEIQQDLGLHGLFLLLALILWVGQHIFQSHKNTQRKRVKEGKVMAEKHVCTYTQISSQSSTQHRTDLSYRTSTRMKR